MQPGKFACTKIITKEKGLKQTKIDQIIIVYL